MSQFVLSQHQGLIMRYIYGTQVLGYSSQLRSFAKLCKVKLWLCKSLPVSGIASNHICVGLLSVDGIDSEFYMTMLCNALDVTNCTSYWNISICAVLTSDVITACSNTHQIQSTSHLNWRVAMRKFIFQYPFFLSKIQIIYSMYYSTNLNVGHSWWVDTEFDTASYKHFTCSTAALFCITEKDRCVQYQLKKVHLHHLWSPLHHIQSGGHFEE